jgi:uncharacterized protein YecT (DUF1311 family)
MNKLINQIAFLTFGVLLFTYCSSDTSINYSKVLSELEIKHQQELDKGESMMQIESEYGNKMDSMLNVVYKDLLSKTEESQKEKIRIKQREWIKERDSVFQEIWRPLNSMIEMNGFAPQDERMFVYSQEAKFIRKRVNELINKLEEK